MFIFQNTSGGTYERKEYGKPVTYIFPKGASINLDGVELNISGLRVECYGGRMDGATNEYFAEVVSRIPSASTNIINTDMFINDIISGGGYPDRDFFNQYKADYLSPKEFNDLQNLAHTLPMGHPVVVKFENIVHFFHKWAADGQNDIKNRLNTILKQNNIFPKCISIMYDDRKLKHTTHIVLEYKSRNECTLRIDNTLSMVGMVGKPLVEQVKKQYQLDLEEARESFSSEKPTFIRFHNKNNPGEGDISLEMASPVKQILFNQAYARMTSFLKSLGVPVKDVAINCSPYNQKLTEECVPFAIQNKINFVEQRKYDGTESVFEMGARIRAEQTLIACLLDGKTSIPRYSEHLCKDMGLVYQPEHWYPNYAEVSASLKKIISKASLEELSALYVAIDLDGCLSLAPSWNQFILECIESKTSLENYSVVGTHVDDTRGQFFHVQLAPSLIFQKNTHTLFASKEYLAQVDRKNLDDAMAPSS